MSRRFSESSLTAISRTEVAVGMVRLASMFSTIRRPTPLMGEASAPSGSTTPGAASRAGSSAGAEPPAGAGALARGGGGAGAGAAAGGAPSPWAGRGAPLPEGSGAIIVAFLFDSDASAPMLSA